MEDSVFSVQFKNLSIFFNQAIGTAVQNAPPSLFILGRANDPDCVDAPLAMLMVQMNSWVTPSAPLLCHVFVVKKMI